MNLVLAFLLLSESLPSKLQVWSERLPAAAQRRRRLEQRGCYRGLHVPGNDVPSCKVAAKGQGFAEVPIYSSSVAAIVGCMCQVMLFRQFL